MDLPLVAAVIGLGVVHGVLPDHGWPIAATYALEFPRKWLRGTIAALILGVGHLVSSIALVLAYFWIATFAEFAEGPWMKPLAGSLLIALGVYEYVSGGHGHAHDEDAEHDHGHAHDDEHGHEDHQHDHDDHNHSHDHSSHEHDHDDHHQHDHSHEHTHDHGDADEGLLARIRGVLPGDGGHQHLSEEHAEQGLMTLGVTALLLGFAHEEPVQILAICAGTEFCLELMLIYSLAVIVAILVPTLLLVAGYEHYQEQVERYTPYLPTLTAVVLVLVGSWFVLEGFIDGGLL